MIDAIKFGKRTGIITGLGIGFVYAVSYLSNVVAVYSGSKLVREDDTYLPGRMLTVSIVNILLISSDN